MNVSQEDAKVIIVEYLGLGQWKKIRRSRGELGGYGRWGSWQGTVVEKVTGYKGECKQQFARSVREVILLYNWLIIFNEEVYEPPELVRIDYALCDI